MSPSGEAGMSLPARCPTCLLRCSERLHAVSQLSAEVIDAVASKLKSETGFLTPARLNGAVAGVIPDAKLAEVVATTLLNVPSERLESLLGWFCAWRERREDNKKILTESTFQILAERLKALCIRYPAFERSQGDGLAQITGDQFSTLRTYFAILLTGLRSVERYSRRGSWPIHYDEDQVH